MKSWIRKVSFETIRTVIEVNRLRGYIYPRLSDQDGRKGIIFV